MRSLLSLALFALVLPLASTGCEIQPLLGRCESSLDCDRTTTVARCVQFANPQLACSSSSTIADCICCPLTVDSNADPEVRRQCTGGGVVTDSGPTTDAMMVSEDVAPEAAPHSCIPADCTPGSTFCQDGECVPLRSAGSACTDGTQCFGGHCTAEMVCCTSECAASGYSCRLPGLEGSCQPIPADGGTDAGSTMDAATPTDASMPMDAATGG